MAEVGGLCEWGLCCQGRWNGEWNYRKVSEALVRLEGEAANLQPKGTRELRAMLIVAASTVT